ncbi:MAG: biopolymer transporter ExbD [Planctomycetota bacterium]
MKTVFRNPGAGARLTLAMTPMIDVVFLLLIFFVCTASFQPLEQVLPSNLVVSGAGAVNAPVEPTPELDEVVLRGEPAPGGAAWWVNATPCPTPAALDTVLGSLAEIDATLPVIIDPAGGVPMGDVIAAYDACRRAGFLSVRFAAAAE